MHLVFPVEYIITKLIPEILHKQEAHLSKIESTEKESMDIFTTCVCYYNMIYGEYQQKIIRLNKAEDLKMKYFKNIVFTIVLLLSPMPSID